MYGYQYDNLGNRLAEYGPGYTTSFSYDAQNLRLTRAVRKRADNYQTLFDVSASYDANGNLKQLGGQNFAWDTRGNLSSISGTTSATFAYDTFGRRTSKTISGTTTTKQWEGWTSLRLFDEKGLTGGQMTDSLGSLLYQPAQNGNPATRYDYAPFGEATATDSANQPAPVTGGEWAGMAVESYCLVFLMTGYNGCEETPMSDESSPESGAAPAPDSSFDLILLDPATVQLFRTEGGTLRATVSDPALGGERTYLQVRVARAFPFSQPDRFIGLRDGKDKEIGVLETTEGMAADSMTLLKEELDRRYFIPRVVAVTEIKEEKGGLVHFDVETDRGPRQFIVQNPRDSITDVTPTRVLITDKDGLRYEFPDLRALDARSAAFFERVT